MEDSARPPVFEALLEHSGWVNSLARSLVGDLHAADDLVQDTWMTAMRRAPVHDANLRGWLSAVVRRMALRRARGESRRRGHEQNAARNDFEPSPEQLLERAEMHRRVVEAVIALREPYRTTVLLRYFEGLGVEELSRRMGVSGSTGRTRLQRALEQLRERFDREHAGDHESWCVAWTALLRRKSMATASPIAPGGVSRIVEVLMAGTASKLVAAGLIAAGVSVAIWIGAFEHPDLSRPAAAEVDQPQPPMQERDAGTFPSEPTAPPGRIVADLPPSPNDAPGSPDLRPIVVRGRLLDSGGRAIEAKNSFVVFVDETGARTVSRPGPGGEYAVSGLAPGTWWVRPHAMTCRPRETTLLLSPGEREHGLDLVLEPAVVLDVRMVTPRGEPIHQAAKRVGISSQALLPVATLDPPGEWFTEVAGSLNNPFGVGEYWHGLTGRTLPPDYVGVLILDCPLPVHVSAVLHHLVLQTKRVELGSDEVEFVISPEELRDRQGEVRMRVVDAETGAPLDRAWVSIYEEGGFTPQAPLGVDGVVDVKEIEPGDMELQVGEPDHAGLHRRIRVEPGRLTDLGTLALERGITLRGQVVDPEGRPVAIVISAGRVDPADRTFRRDSRTWATSAEDGRFELKGLQRGSNVLWTVGDDQFQNPANPTDLWLASRATEVEVPSPEAEPLRLPLVRCTAVSLRVESPDPKSLRFSVADEHGWPLRGGRFYGGAPQRLKLPPGTYTLAVLDRGGAVVHSERFVVGDEPVKLLIRPK